MERVFSVGIKKIGDGCRAQNDHAEVGHTKKIPSEDQNIELTGILNHARNAGDGSDPWHILRGSNGPSCITKNSEKHGQDKQDAEFRFIDALIAFGKPNGAPVGQRTSDASCKNNPNNTT